LLDLILRQPAAFSRDAVSAMVASRGLSEVIVDVAADELSSLHLKKSRCLYMRSPTKENGDQDKRGDGLDI